MVVLFGHLCRVVRDSIGAVGRDLWERRSIWRVARLCVVDNARHGFERWRAESSGACDEVPRRFPSEFTFHEACAETSDHFEKGHRFIDNFRETVTSFGDAIAG